MQLRPNPVERIRKSIARWAEGNDKCSLASGWGITTPIGIAAPRIHRNLEKLHNFLPPRVCSSAFRTISNGWCTHRRFQNRMEHTNRCVLGCGGKAEDSIEHYCRCPVTLSVLSKVLRVAVAPCHGIAFWVMDFSNDDDMVLCSALSSYAAYKTFNLYRTSGKAVKSAVAADAMRQFIIQAAGKDAKLGKFLDSRWAVPVRIFQYSAHIRRRADSRYNSVDVGQTNSQYNTDNRNLQVSRP